MNDIKATVFDIQRFSLHDGPGIRTTVFLKGCPLNCLWCHNPESKSKNPEIMLHPTSCIGCGECVRVCEEKLHTFTELTHEIDRNSCQKCGKCATACVGGALTLSGTEMTVDAVLSEVMRDKTFYDNSGGGVTVSGGEPLLHTDFCVSLLTQAKEQGITTAVETSGFGKWENIERLSKCVDLFLWDYKETSPQLHREYTGVDNSLILENLSKLSGLGASVVLRCPIIPGLNDREEHFKGIADVANKHASVIRVELEPYHSLGKGKAAAIGKDYPLAEIKTVSKAEAKVWQDIISAYTDKKVIIS